MRMWRTDLPILHNPTGWVAGDLVDSANPGMHLVKNDDGTIFGGDGVNHPAGTDNSVTQCWLPEARTTLAYPNGQAYGIMLFP